MHIDKGRSMAPMTIGAMALIFPFTLTIE